MSLIQFKIGSPDNLIYEFRIQLCQFFVELNLKLKKINNNFSIIIGQRDFKIKQLKSKMKKALGLFSYISTLFSLKSQYRYQLLFLISNALYHSLDYFFKATNDGQSTSFVFGLLDAINFQILRISFTLISLCMIGIIIVNIFILKKENYTVEILQRIIFPLQFYQMIRIGSGSNLQKNNIDYQKFGFTKILFLGSISLSVILIFLKNFKFNLRYADNSEKGFNRLCKLETILLLIKLIVALFCALAIRQRPIVYLLLIFILNLLTNFFFSRNIFYENPNLEYMTALTQLYMWIPWICGILNFYKFQPISIQIFQSFGFIIYTIVGTRKSKFLMTLLEKKYIHKIQQLIISKSESRRQHSLLSNEKTNIQIIFISLLKQFLYDKQKIQLYWSQPFRTKLFNILFELLDENQKKQKLKIETSYQKNSVRNIEQKLPSVNKPFLSQTIRLKTILCNIGQIDNSIEHLVIWNQLWRLINGFLLSSKKEESQLRIFICYNFIDTSNIMKLRLFYSFFLNNSQSTSIFDRISNSICYSFLVNKIGEQKHSTQEHSAFMPQIKIDNENMIKSQKENKPIHLNQASQMRQECGVGFDQNFKNVYSANFNNVVEEHRLFKSILSQLELFSQNQYRFNSLKRSASGVFKYLQKRNSLRKSIESQVLKYCHLNQTFNKFYISALFTYIKDFWLNRNPILAEENFRTTLQSNFRTIDSFKISRLKVKGSELNHNQRNLSCVVSGIQAFDTIVTSCPTFKNLLEINEFVNVSRFSQKELETQQNSTQGPQTKLSSLMLPLWRQQHDKLFEHNHFYEDTVDHIEKRYFFLSHKKTRILEIKFKMYFHMLYEKDLLIVLDIAYQKVKNLIILNEDKNEILFHHESVEKNCNSQRVSNIKGEQIRDKMQCSSEDYRSSLNQIQMNQFFLNFRFEVIQIFRRPLQIYTNKQQEQLQIGTAQHLNQHKKKRKSCLQFQNDQGQLQKLRKQKRLKQIKFYQYKEGFSQFRFLFVVTSIFIFLAALMGVIMHFSLVSNQKDQFLQLLNVMNNKIEIEEDYTKQEFYKPVDLEMITNIYSMQINIGLMKPEERILLISQITGSIKNSLQVMKNKHRIDPFTISDTIENREYFNYAWVPGYNRSFQIKAYFNEMAYLRCLGPIIKVTQTHKTNPEKNRSYPSDISLALTIPTGKVNYLQFYNSMKYLNILVADQLYFFNETNSIVYKFGQAEKSAFITVINRFNLRLTITAIVLGFVFVMGFILIFAVSRKLGNMYFIVQNVSSKFVDGINRQRQNLDIFLKGLTKFSRDKAFGMINKRIINEDQIKAKQSYIVLKTKKSHITIQSTHSQIRQQDSKSPQNNKNIHQSQKQDHNLAQGLLNSPLCFTIRFIKYPIVRIFILVFILASLATEHQKKMMDFKNFSTGIYEITKINFSLLNLMSNNLFMSTMGTFKLSPDQEAAAMQLMIENFNKVIKDVSTTDKTSIISQMFLNDEQNEEVINKILYTNVCQQLAQQMNCPIYIQNKVKGLSEKYSETMKNINQLFLKLISAPRTVYGTINSTDFQNRFLSSYENVYSLLYITDRVKRMAFARLQQSLGLGTLDHNNSEYDKGFSLYNPKIVAISFLFFFLECVWIVINIFSEVNVVQEEFLRIGSGESISKENGEPDGYNKFFNIAQHSRNYLFGRPTFT